MKRKLFIICLVTWVGGLIWANLDPVDGYGFHFFFFGWIGSLLIIGYSCTPSNSVYGKTAFASVIIMVIGVAFKLLHLAGANALIIAGLLGIAATYLAMWLAKKIRSGN